jgi:phage recombination protein Bet
MNALVEFHGKQLDLIRKTVAKDCNPAEFDHFIHICKAVRLDPLRSQIYAFVFGKDDPAKRRMTIVTSIGGYRAIAERTGNYRPGKTETVIDPALKDPNSNPLGISHATATVYKYVHGEWHEFSETAYWDEYAPLVEEGDDFDWVDTGKVYPPGHKKAGKPMYRKQQLGDMTRKLDPQKPTWRKMGRTMIEKCAEARALRRGWPDDFEGLYSEDEVAQAHTLDLTATELADEAAVEAKLALVGGKDALTVMWEHGAKLERVPAGQFCDRAMEWASAEERTSTEIDIWWNANLPARTEYKARHGAEYLEFQKEWEKNKLRVENAEITQEAAE